MTKQYLFYFLLVITINSFAQTTTVVTGLSNPVGLALNGNDLYVGSVGNQKVMKKDLSDTTTTLATDYLTNISFPGFLLLIGDYLYIPQVSDSKVTRIDVSDPNSSPEDVVTGINTPIGLALRGNDLYISLRFSNKIVKIDISQSNPSPTDVVTGINGWVNGLAFYGNDLYFSHNNTSISKIDVTQVNPNITEVTPMSGGAGIRIKDNYLYVARPNESKVSRFDVTQTTPTITDVVSALNTPWDIIVTDNFLYISEQFGAKVSRFDLTTLSTENSAQKVTFEYYPNPTSGLLSIKGLEDNATYKITDINGKIVLKGKTINNSNLDISDLKNGIYFLRINEYQIKKIIKK
ncbi:T9SS type A sorting domain-containing protein [Kordia jejudonensis]|uniref:T9SS type A sorting domain-containing protein n=1 Tax=Kordia jejudonensis TaxID=1348245 RepID=UPI000629841A|nr:T9SS type A sorting domain-containing protein [Kordia jejudonensis]